MADRSAETGKMEMVPALTNERLAEIAHELRTPLGGIEAMAGILARGTLSETQRQAVDALLASVAHLRHVAGDILDDHRNRVQGQEADEAALVDIRDFLSPISVAAKSQADAKDLMFSARVFEGVPEHIRANATQLRQMVENLLDNAFKVTSSGGVHISIDRLERRGHLHRLRFAVRDTGPGFTVEESAQLF